MSETYNCPECKDTGVYQGLNSVEPCRACGGFRSLGEFAKAVMTAETGGPVDSRLQRIEIDEKQTREDMDRLLSGGHSDTSFVIDQLQKAFGKIAPSTLEAFSTMAAHWACDLNGWEWPKQWGEQPDWITAKFAKHGRERYEHDKERYASLIGSVNAFTTRKETLRVHNVERRKAMTNDEFEAWYASECERHDHA